MIFYHIHSNLSFMSFLAHLFPFKSYTPSLSSLCSCKVFLLCLLPGRSRQRSDHMRMTDANKLCSISPKFFYFINPQNLCWCLDAHGFVGWLYIIICTFQITSGFLPTTLVGCCSLSPSLPVMEGWSSAICRISVLPCPQLSSYLPQDFMPCLPPASATCGSVLS